MDKKILLIADDDEMNRLIIRKFLKNDYEVIEAADGKEAMEILHSRHVDALLLDIIMPEMDGLKVLEEMKKDKKLEYVGVLVATSTKEKTEREALSLGADDIVSKPYDPIVIKKRMENILAMKTMHAQRKLLENDEIKSFIQTKHAKLSGEIGMHVTKIQKFTDIIRANKSNYKLVDEILDEIKVEAGNVLEAVEKES